MKFDLRKPCPGCPFRKGNNGPVRLYKVRAAEVWTSSMRDGAPFMCHKTLDRSSQDEEEYSPLGSEQHCFGAHLAGVKSGQGPNQLCRIAEQLKPDLAAAADDESNQALVFGSLLEMLEVSLRRWG